MKKLFLMSLMLVFAGLIASKVYADPSWGNGGSMNYNGQHHKTMKNMQNSSMGMMQPGGMWGMQSNNNMMGMQNNQESMMMWKIKKDIATNCKDAMKIKAQMRELRMQTIMSDPKLREELNRIKVLKMRLYKDTYAKLQKNQKYRNDEHWKELIHKKLVKDIRIEIRLQMQMINRMMQGM